jgi:hypothetical protein
VSCGRSNQGTASVDPSILQRLHEVVNYFDVADIVNVTQFRGYLIHEQVLSSIRLFAERVMPVFQPAITS